MSTTRTYEVVGMTCEHCVRAVTDELSGLPEVSDVAVELVAGGRSRVHVTSEARLPEPAVRSAVAEAGYDLA